MLFDIFFCNFYTLWLDYNVGLTENVALTFVSMVQTTDGYS